ncbi:DNA primase [Myxacorys almedinensis]|uniref:DNA primase n=1 Tax=Myxacorys almedinensis A TaxID=2690445 RepID=A0A8J7Z166_9CYAN|nr:DNA primase [Myxacorys almedinensis]NDJ16253.1 DNA primase [Myxacorys almedinensis A]
MNVPRLHPDTIEQVKQRADIVDVVSEHVVLKKQGKDFVGLCPFHDDKSPSFSVSPSKQFYYCFSCGAGGNAVKFLMELGKRNFGDVILELAKKYQISVQTLQVEERQELQRQLSVREQLYEILAIAAKFYEHALHQSGGRAALTYLRDDRKLSAATIGQFGLGYAPGGWETLHNYLVEQKKYPVALVEQAGLVVPRKTGDGYYDRFRDRLIIPIHDLQGRVIGFGGRTLSNEQPKYLNSPETELFDKGKTLFGLDKARAAIAKRDQAVVVEGYFDVIALHTAGITNAVASLGTALSMAQVRQLLRYSESKRVVFNFDADRAGVQAAERAIGEVAALAYQGEVRLHVLNIPDGKDPDDFLQSHSANDYQALLDDAPLWIDWQIQQVLLHKDLKQADHFEQAAVEIVSLLGNLPNPNLRTHYIQHAAELLSQNNSRLMPQIEENLRLQVRGQRWHGRSQKWQTPGDRTLLEECESQLLRIYLQSPEHRSLITEALEAQDLDFSLSHHRFLWRQIQEIQTDHQPQNLMERLRDRCTEFPREMNQVYALFELDEKTQLDVLRSPLVIRSALAGMEQVMCDKRRRHFLDLWKVTDCVATPELGQYYVQKMQAEEQRLRELDRQRRTNFVDLVKVPLEQSI